MSKETLLTLCIGVYLGIVIGISIKPYEDKKPKPQYSWMEYTLKADTTDYEMPYEIYDADGTFVGIIPAECLDNFTNQLNQN